MTFQISRRGKQYLETAQTLLRVAQTMTDSAIAYQLKMPTTTSGEQRKLRIDAAKAFARPAASAASRSPSSLQILSAQP